MCDCIDISFTYNGTAYVYSIDKSGTRNGKNEYVSERGEIYWYEDGYWICNLFFDGFESYNRSLIDTDCPVINNWSNTDPVEVENLGTRIGNCCCVKVSYSYQDVDYTYNVPLSDTVIPIGGYLNDYYLDLEDGYFIQIVWIESGVWLLDINTPNGAAQLINVTETSCPISNNWVYETGLTLENLITTECFEYVEDRQKFEYKSIKLPGICVDEDRGLDDCCCEELVLAKTTSNSFPFPPHLP